MHFPVRVHLSLTSKILTFQHPATHSPNFIEYILSIILSIQNELCPSLLVSSVLELKQNKTKHPKPAVLDQE